MFHLSRKIYSSLLIIFFLFAGTNACKDDYTSVIPSVYVSMNINPTNFIELNIPGGSYYFADKGYGGIILFRDLTDSSNPFLAFDATCTHEVSSTTRVVADASGIATCPTCKSQFILFSGNGSPIKGPAVEPLRQYHTSFIGGRIIISN
jgi:Rieske Fe-S protein